MVEFAIIMPLLMLMLFGVVEFGRYVAVVHAVESGARNGARFAATTGGSPAHYVDCDAIRGVVRDTVMMSPSATVDITYENDIGDMGGLGCQDPANPPGIDAFGPTARVQVTVRETFNAITPLIGGFLDNVLIEVSDERTIVKANL